MKLLVVTFKSRSCLQMIEEPALHAYIHQTINVPELRMSDIDTQRLANLNLCKEKAELSCAEMVI